jgi:hypothetical protein
MTGKRRDLKRRARQIASFEVDPVARQWPSAPPGRVVHQRGDPATDMQASEPAQLGGVEVAVDDRHEVEVASAGPKRFHAR